MADCLKGLRAWQCSLRRMEVTSRIAARADRSLRCSEARLPIVCCLDSHEPVISAPTPRWQRNGCASNRLATHTSVSMVFPPLPVGRLPSWIEDCASGSSTNYGKVKGNAVEIRLEDGVAWPVVARAGRPHLLSTPRTPRGGRALDDRVAARPIVQDIPMVRIQIGRANTNPDPDKGSLEQGSRRWPRSTRSSSASSSVRSW